MTKSVIEGGNRIERFFNKLKQFRRIATRYDKLQANLHRRGLASRRRFPHRQEFV